MEDEYYRLHAELEHTYWWFAAKNRIILSLVDRYAPRADRRLRACDIGAGAGGVLAPLAERFDAVGVDLSPMALEYCRGRGLQVAEGALPDKLPFSPNSFDVITASEVIEHVEQDAAAVSAILRLLRPGGILVCTVPANQWMWSTHDASAHHVRRYSWRGFSSLFERHPDVRTELMSFCNTAMFLPIAAVRVARRYFPAREGTPSIKPLPRPINAALQRIFEFEGALLPWVRLPFGVTLISVHRKLPAVPVAEAPAFPLAQPAA